MSSRLILPTKLAASTVPVTCDFISQLAQGEAIISLLVVASVVAGVDPDPSAIISGSGSVAQNVGTQVITGGLPGVTYQLAFGAVTNHGNSLVIYALLAVLDFTSMVAL